MDISWLFICGLILIAYLLGSIPTGYLIALALKGIDIREYGSGSTGATNVLRNVGKGAAIVVLLIDMLKGSLAIYAVKLTYLYVDLPAEDWLIVSCALLALIGHSKSVWLKFTGGKSAATSLGILLTINLWLGLSTLGVFLTVLGISRIVSLSSISAAIWVALFTFLLMPTTPYITFGILAGVYVIYRHITNIQRLLKGTEPRIGQKSEELTIDN